MPRRSSDQIIVTVSLLMIVGLFLVSFGGEASVWRSGTHQPQQERVLPSTDIVQMPAVPSDHPRVYVRPSDVRVIRARIGMPEFLPAWKDVHSATTDPESGYLFRAFVYLVTGDPGQGRRAIDGALAALLATTDGRTFGSPFHFGALVYDWCYDLLSEHDKQVFIRHFERLADSHAPGYPASLEAPALAGHGVEGWLLTGQLPAGLAIYDESPILFQAASRLFLAQFRPALNFQYTGHGHSQGDSYSSRFLHDQAASWLFRRIGAGDILSREQHFVPYQVVYNLRPDGQQMRRGDTFDDAGTHLSKWMAMLLTAFYYEDPYLFGLARDRMPQEGRAFASLFTLLFKPDRLQARPLGDLPRSKFFPHPIGEMVTRTGWTLGADSKDAVMTMRIGNYFFGNHQHKDFGSFQIYYRGALAIASGAYEGDNGAYATEHWQHYYHQTIAHNGLLVLDPTEGLPVNDGGQRGPNGGNDHPRNLRMLTTHDYEMGNVLAHEIGPDSSSPDYSYLSGDITRAYSNKVDRVTRSMVALNFHDLVYPASLVILDRVTATDPSFKKTWLLHTVQEPKIEGQRVTVAFNQQGPSGKLVVDALLPAQARIAMIGGPGREFWIESAQKNFATSKAKPAEPGAWRVEVSPSRPRKDDLFLHVLTVMDGEVATGPDVHRIEGTDLVGARVRDRTVLFSRQGTLLAQAELTIDGPDQMKVLICDLLPGAWAIFDREQALVAKGQATEAGTCGYFTVPPGEYGLKNVSAMVEGRERTYRPSVSVPPAPRT
jgi:heparin/heparan-sulfate lyase